MLALWEKGEFSASWRCKSEKMRFKKSFEDSIKLQYHLKRPSELPQQDVSLCSFESGNSCVIIYRPFNKYCKWACLQYSTFIFQTLLFVGLRLVRGRVILPRTSILLCCQVYFQKYLIGEDFKEFSTQNVYFYVKMLSYKRTH